MGSDVGPYLILAVQVDLAAVFLVAGLAKLRAPRQFMRAVAEYHIVPRAAVVVGPAVIASEWFVFAAYASGQLLTVASLIAASWLSVFAVVTWVNLRRGRLIPCHCFGNADELIGGRTLARIGLIGAGVALVTVARIGANGPSAAVLGPAEVVATAGLAVFIGLASTWLVHASELRAMVRLANGRS